MSTYFSFFIAKQLNNNLIVFKNNKITYYLIENGFHNIIIYIQYGLKYKKTLQILKLNKDIKIVMI